MMHDMARAAGAVPTLSPEAEADLMRRWADHGDERARDAVVLAHMRMSVGCAARYAKASGREAADLVQEGHLAMITAAAKFEPGRNLRFSTYARWWVRAGVQDVVIRDEAAPSASGKARRTLFFNHARTRLAVERELGPGALRRDVDAEVARRLGVTPEEAHAASLGPGRVSSLDTPAGEDADVTRGDLVPSGEPGPYECLEREQDAGAVRVALASAMATLLPREKEIILARKFCEDGDEETLETLALRYGISRERVRQVEGRALEKLRRALGGRRPADD